jgi:hypothetical protein
MVTIIDYRVHQNSEGKPFCSLLLQGELELVKSSQTGRFYATARKASMTSTFNEVMCKQLIGKELPGGIIKEQSEPYEYTLPESGEKIMLEHRYVYVPEPKQVEKVVFA